MSTGDKTRVVEALVREMSDEWSRRIDSMLRQVAHEGHKWERHLGRGFEPRDGSNIICTVCAYTLPQALEHRDGCHQLPSATSAAPSMSKTREELMNLVNTEAAKRLALMQRIELATTWELECFAAYLERHRGGLISRAVAVERYNRDLYYGSMDRVHEVALAEND